MKYLVLLLLLSIVPACAPPPTITTTPGKIAFQADQVVIRINELQNAAIQAENTHVLETGTARTIVEFCVSANKVLRTAPAGWQVTVIQLWREAAPKISTTNTSVQLAITALTGLLGAL